MKEDLSQKKELISEPTTTENQRVEKKPKSHIGCSIFNLLCCCCPIGLIAVYFSIQTHKSREKNNLENAKSYSSKAYIFNVLAPIFGVLFLTIWAIRIYFRIQQYQG